MKKTFCFVRTFVIAALLAFSFTSCVTTGFNDFYQPWHEPQYFPEDSYLGVDENPQIIQASDLNTMFREVSSNWYWCIGYSGFNSSNLEPSEINKALLNLCKEKRAKIAIYSKVYTDTRNGAYSVPHTDYHYYRTRRGEIRSYATTSYTTEYYSVRRYDFSSYLFVSIPDTYKAMYLPGFSLADLTQQDRERYKQNTGCFIDIVYKNTPAYYANLLHGDIITRINGTPVYSVADFMELKKSASVGDSWIVTFIRDGVEKQVSLIVGL